MSPQQGQGPAAGPRLAWVQGREGGGSNQPGPWELGGRVQHRVASTRRGGLNSVVRRVLLWLRGSGQDP